MKKNGLFAIDDRCDTRNNNNKKDTGRIIWRRWNGNESVLQTRSMVYSGLMRRSSLVESTEICTGDVFFMTGDSSF